MYSYHFRLLLIIIFRNILYKKSALGTFFPFLKSVIRVRGDPFQRDINSEFNKTRLKDVESGEQGILTG